MAQTIFNCSSFSSTGACSVAQAGFTGNFLVRNGGNLAGSIIDFIPANSGHNGYGLWYVNPENIQAFTTTFRFIPNGQNFSFVVQNATTNPGYTGNIFSSGAGCEGGFYQGFGVAPNNLFALEFDSNSWLAASPTAFTYSSVQIYQQNQSPCNPNDGGANYWLVNKFSTSPVPLNSPASSATTTTGDTYSATVAYDGSNLTLNLYDVTAGGSCPGASCFTQGWSNLRIPSLVDGTTAYVGFTGGINIANLPQLTVSQWSYQVNSPITTPGSTPPVAGGTTAVNPTFSPAAGTYSGTQHVAIASTTSGANICYTLASGGLVITPLADNLGGCAVGTAYTGPVAVASSQTLYAIAGTTAATLPSGVMQGAYTINGATPQGTLSMGGKTIVGGKVTLQ